MEGWRSRQGEKREKANDRKVSREIRHMRMREGNERQEETTRQTKRRDRWRERINRKREKTDVHRSSEQTGRRGERQRETETVGERKKMYVSALFPWQILLWGASPMAPAPHFPTSRDCPLLGASHRSVRVFWCLPQGTMNSRIETLSLVLYPLPLSKALNTCV